MADLRVTSITGAEGAIAEEAVEEFKSSLRGELLAAGDDGYEDARGLFNAIIDKRPALIARCSGTADVIDAVNFARNNDLLVAVRGGGHGVAGNASCDGGIMIDLSQMKGVQVDPKARTARAQGGATWGDLDRETQAFGLAAPGGVVSTTGIAGLTLGGGMGWLRRKYGLSIDNLLSVDIVTADGKLLTASSKENEDLFWGVRGGGGNFGVVTSFEFRLHPVGPIVMLAGPMYPAEGAGDVLRSWRDFMATAPDEITSNAIFMTIPEGPMFPEETHGKRVIVLAAVYAGPADEGEKAMQPLREFGTPVIDLSHQAPYTMVQGMFDPFFPKGELFHYWKSLDLNSYSDEVIDAIVDHAAGYPSTVGLVDTWYMGGAVSRVGADETAFGDRSSQFLLVLNTSWADPQDSDRNIAWTRELWADMKRFSSGSLYLNFPGQGEEGEDLVRSAYGANYQRLVALKNKYDPTNLFRLNQNIRPSA